MLHFNSPKGQKSIYYAIVADLCIVVEPNLIKEQCAFWKCFLKRWDMWINCRFKLPHSLVQFACKAVWLNSHLVCASLFLCLGCGLCHLCVTALCMNDHSAGCTPCPGNQEGCGPHLRLSKTTTAACNYDFSSREFCTLCGFCVNRRKQSTSFEGKVLVQYRNTVLRLIP